MGECVHLSLVMRGFHSQKVGPSVMVPSVAATPPVCVACVALGPCAAQGVRSAAAGELRAAPPWIPELRST